MNTMTKKKVEQIYNIKAVCALLMAPRVTVIRWISEGNLKAFKVRGGRLWRFRESDIQRFLDNK
jgi:excisionase family DNA binding protein